jgi:type I restriction enzyme S subunit
MRPDVTEYSDTPLGQLPNDWKVTPLSTVAQPRYGKARPKSEGLVPVIGSSGVFASCGEILVDFPTLVVGRKGSAGQVWFVDTPCWPSDTTFYLEWKSKDVLPEFIGAFFSLNPLSGQHAQTTMPSLQRQDLEDALIPFPPLPEQRRIAAVLTAIQDAIAAQEDVIAAARTFKRSLMHRLFTYGPGREPAPTKETEIGEIPAHWEVSHLETVVVFTHKPRSLTISDYALIPFIPMELIPDGRVFANKYELRPNSDIRSGTYCEPGDFLLAKITPSFENGKQALLTPDLPLHFAYATTEVYAMKGIANVIHEMYMFYFFQQAQIRTDLARKMEGTTGRQRIPLAVLQKYLVPVPPLREQDVIIDWLLATDEKIAAEEDRLSALQALFKSMLHQLMTGQIRLLSDEGISDQFLTTDH